jgi:endonuclease/exonuclease/phosphatase (EEP) superfamily protein YafD
MLMLAWWIVVGLGLFMVAGTLLGLSRSAHWFVRGWDFPRVQIAGLAGGSGLAYAALFSRGAAPDRAFLGATLGCALWQLWKIYPYTVLAPRHPVRRRVAASRSPAPARVRLLVANVLLENPAHERLLELVDETDPDIVLAVETDERWARALAPLERSHPHVVRRPQDNCYGLMLFSRLPLLDARVEFLVQHDIPSVHAAFELAGRRIQLHGLHPRPPEPIRGQHSSARDAELVRMGLRIAAAGGGPTIVAGDLNDVAWSPTTELFLRLTGLLDPRRGRGLFNSWNANVPVFRFPLDHVFHSAHFHVAALRRCGHIGSDHFPMLVELSYESDAAEQSRPGPGDAREAQKRLDMHAATARSGGDRPAAPS